MPSVYVLSRLCFLVVIGYSFHHKCWPCSLHRFPSLPFCLYIIFMHFPFFKNVCFFFWSGKRLLHSHVCLQILCFSCASNFGCASSSGSDLKLTPLEWIRTFCERNFIIRAIKIVLSTFLYCYLVPLSTFPSVTLKFRSPIT